MKNAQSAASNENDAEERLLAVAALIDEFEGYATRDNQIQEGAHAARIAVSADALAIKLQFGAHDRFVLRQAALVHDIGELAMNRPYIKANRVLTRDERIDVRRHTVVGEQEAAKRGLGRAVQLLVRWHHEWWNGSGYPDAVEREQIPLAARILRVADTYAALRSERPYRDALSAAKAEKYLTDWAGIEFDPRVVKMFLTTEEREK